MACTAIITSVNKSQAKKVWERAYDRIMSSRVLDTYEIRELTPEFIEIGCHKIMLSEINAIATELAWK